MRSTTRTLIVISIVFVVLFATAGIGTYMQFAKAQAAQKGTTTEKVYRALQTLPQLQGRHFLGAPNASITIIAYLDLTTLSSQQFMVDIFPQLEKEYIDTGEIKYYHKHHITQQDITDNNEAYQLNRVMHCISQAPAQSYRAMYDRIAAQPGQALKIVQQDNSTTACQDNPPARELLEDATEVYDFGFEGISPQIMIGIKGRDNTVITGVPNYDSLRQTVRQYRIRIGQ